MPRHYAHARSVPQFGFPATKHVQMRYVSMFNFTLPDAHPTQAVFSANSINDPLVVPSTGGHRPSGYAQWEPFYNQYLVVGSKCTATVTATGDSNENEPTIVALELLRLVPDATTPAGSMGQRLELSPQIAWCQLPGNDSFVKPTVISNTFSARKWFTRSDILDNWDDLGADFGSDPIEQVYYVLSMGDNANNAQSGEWEFVVEIEYSVMLAEPRTLTQSATQGTALDFDYDDMYPGGRPAPIFPGSLDYGDKADEEKKYQEEAKKAHLVL